MKSVIDDYPEACPECGNPLLMDVNPDDRPGIAVIFCPECQWETDRAEVRIKTIDAPVCSWSGDFETDQWETACRRTFSLINGNPAENEYSYCPGCGRKIEDVSKFEEEEE